jgi:hypothetical protein
MPRPVDRVKPELTEPSESTRLSRHEEPFVAFPILDSPSHRATDYVPCCFSAYSGLRQRCVDQRDYVDRQLELGLDVVVELGELPVRHDPRVVNRQWREEVPGEPYPLLHSEYETPTGTLHGAVRISADWEHGDHVPFLSDLNIVRSHPQIVTADSSLEALGYLLVPPTEDEVRAYESHAQASRRLAEERGRADDIRREVRQAVSTLAPGGGVILAPVTNVRADTEVARRNVDALIDEWKRVRG